MAIVIVLGGLGSGQSYGDQIAAMHVGAHNWSSSVGRLTPSHPGEERHGQVFTSLLSEQLTTIEVNLRRVYDPPVTPNTVIVSVYDVAGGVPTGAPLGMQTMPLLDLGWGTNTYYPFDFTPDNINLVAGTQYAFMVGTDVNGGSASFQPVGVGNTNKDTYTSGTAIHDFGSGPYVATGDANFVVRVIPEPASVALLGLGAMAMLRRHGRA